jgi:hypothetical protein
VEGDKAESIHGKSRKLFIHCSLSGAIKIDIATEVFTRMRTR